MKSLLYFLISCGIAISLFLNGCSDLKIDSTIHPLVAAYSTGAVSVLAPIIVKFTDNTKFKKHYQKGDVVEKGIFETVPNIDADAIWIDDNTVELRHYQPLQYNQSYKVNINIAKIADIKKDMPSGFTFEVNTNKLNFTSYIDHLSLYDNKTPDKFYVKGTIYISDFADNKQVEKMLQLPSNPYKITWTHHKEENTHTFRIDTIYASTTPYDISFTIDGSPIDHKGKKQETITVPEIGAFKFVDLEVRYFPEFVMIATFSAPIDNKQRLKDKFVLNGEKGIINNLRFAVDLNKIYIYPPSRQVGNFQIIIDKSLNTNADKKLNNDIVKKVVFEDLKPSVKFIGKGAILPSDNKMSVPFMAVNYQEIEVVVQRIFENNVLQFLQENELSSGYELYRVGKEVARTTIKLGESNADKIKNWSTYSLDLSKIITPVPGALYRIKLEGKKPLKDAKDDNSNISNNNDEEDYYDYDYYRKASDRERNILASDLGMIAKRDDNNNLNIVVTNLITAMPEQDIQVKVFDFTNQFMAEAITNAQGIAFLSLKDAPFLVVAMKGNQRGYLKVADGKNLSLSSFDVSGLATKKGLKGYLYGERGVWRPGDKIFLSFVLMDKNNILPKNHPVKFEFINPLGQTITNQVKTQGNNGIYLFELQTNEDAPTGTWKANVMVGGETFSMPVKIETVKPNRLKINFNLNDNPYLKASDVSGTIASAWLTGASATNLNVKVNVKLMKTKSIFKGFEEYVFDDMTKDFSTEEEELINDQLDENGQLNFKKSLSIEGAPGQVKAQFTARVYEPSGDFSIDQYTTTCNPYSSFVGLKTPPETGDYYKMLETDKNQIFKVVTLSNTGTPKSVKNLSVEIFKVDWHWWWNSSSEGLASYAHNSSQKVIDSKTIATQNGYGEFGYKWDKYDWGYYLIKVTDPNSKHSTSKVCYVDWGYGDHSQQAAGNAATMLKFKADKDKYKVGENAIITIPSSQGARALVSVESGSKVLNMFWINCNAGQTQFAIPLDTNCTPNVYVNVSLIQPHAQTINDAPMRLYGVIPLLVEDANTKLTPVISMPSVVKPETEFAINVSEKNATPMSYTLAIVDDGLLDLTRFKTPDPWNTFFAREALGIKTWDYYDDVIGAYGGKIEQLFAIGGDGEIANKSQAKAQRFKPVVVFMGVFTLNKGETKTHKIKLPPYVGSVRTMVVATNSQAFGSAEQTTQVRKPLMATMTLPRVIGTDEEFLLPVTIFAMENTVKNVSVSLKNHTNFEVMGSKVQNISFDKIGDKVVYFRLKATSSEDIGKVSIEATCPNDNATDAQEIDIRDPNPYFTNTSLFMIEKGKDFNGFLHLVGVKGTNTATIEVSTVPPLNLGERLRYLLQYPHGCIEQTTSAVFPQLYLQSVMNTDEAINKRTDMNIKAAINRLQFFQTSDGGFSYWAGESYFNRWGTNYVTHFLVEAEKIGYAIPNDMKKRALDFESSLAKSWTNTVSDAVDQAYRLYVLALARQPERGAMNRLFEQKEKISNEAQWFLATAFALDGKNNIAQQIINFVAQAPATSRYNPFDPYFGSEVRAKAVVVEAFTTMKNKTNAFPVVQQISDILNSSQWLSTQSTAWALMAMSKFIDKNKEDIQLSYNYVADNQRNNIKTMKPLSETKLHVGDKTGQYSIKVNNTSNTTLYVKFIVSGKAEKGQETAKQNNVQITVNYFDMYGKPIDVSQIKQGTDFEAYVTITNTGKMATYTNMVLSQIFPSGWEIRNDRLNNDESETEQSTVRYQDIRDDRIYSYFDLQPNRTKAIKVQLTATFVGKFYLPAVACEAMYNNNVNAYTVGKWVEVVK